MNAMSQLAGARNVGSKPWREGQRRTRPHCAVMWIASASRVSPAQRDMVFDLRRTHSAKDKVSAAGQSLTQPAAHRLVDARQCCGMETMLWHAEAMRGSNMRVDPNGTIALTSGKPAVSGSVRAVQRVCICLGRETAICSLPHSPR